MVPQSGNVPEDPAVGEDGDRVVLGVPRLVHVPQVGAIVGMRIGQHMNVSEPGMEHIRQGQRDAFPAHAAVGELPPHLAVAVPERRLAGIGDRAHDRSPDGGTDTTSSPPLLNLPQFGGRVLLACRPDGDYNIRTWVRGRRSSDIEAARAGRTPRLSDARSKLVILGIGDDGLAGLTESARRIVTSADVILGAPSILKLLESVPARKQALEPDMSLALRQVREALQTPHPVLVSGGDPLFYGLARYLCDRLGKDRFEVVPHVSSMQLAFARVKESWEDAYLANLATQPLEVVLDKIRIATKVGLFTTERHSPGVVAEELLRHKIDYFTGFVCENLGSPDERVTHAELVELVEQPFAPLNVMILVRRPNAPDRPREAIGRRLFGNPDDAFLQSKPKKGLLTPSE